MGRIQLNWIKSKECNILKMFTVTHVKMVEYCKLQVHCSLNNVDISWRSRCHRRRYCDFELLLLDWRLRIYDLTEGHIRSAIADSPWLMCLSCLVFFETCFDFSFCLPDVLHITVFTWNFINTGFVFVFFYL